MHRILTPVSSRLRDLFTFSLDSSYGVKNGFPCLESFSFRFDVSILVGVLNPLYWSDLQLPANTQLYRKCLSVCLLVVGLLFFYVFCFVFVGVLGEGRGCLLLLFCVERRNSKKNDRSTGTETNQNIMQCKKLLP